ncbi:hypothetical protein ACLIBG_00275 [Virgibacillus sp. W0181]|uniref:hypothetical protein n=1 Tax=Virgibacillus sp. W0181 TaxID=3391581 RepID=UPI003F44ACF4
MQMEEKIIGMLEQIMDTQGEHSQILDNHSKKLDEHTQILSRHSEILDEHSRKHDNHESTLKEHGQLLTALRSGQEHLKAEIEGMKISDAKEFGNLKEQIKLNTEMFRDELWVQKQDLYRIKNTMGMG